jgi:predicted DNA-binding WGR domain protein
MKGGTKMKYFSNSTAENVAREEDMEQLKPKEAYVEQKKVVVPEHLTFGTNVLENDGGEIGRPVL